jgi:hypothetical protein
VNAIVNRDEISAEGAARRVERRLIAGLDGRDVVFDGRAPSLEARGLPGASVRAASALAVGHALFGQLVFADDRDHGLGGEIQIDAAGCRRSAEPEHSKRGVRDGTREAFLSVAWFSRVAALAVAPGIESVSAVFGGDGLRGGRSARARR